MNAASPHGHLLPGAKSEPTATYLPPLTLFLSGQCMAHESIWRRQATATCAPALSRALFLSLMGLPATLHCASPTHYPLPPLPYYHTDSSLLPPYFTYPASHHLSSYIAHILHAYPFTYSLACLWARGMKKKKKKKKKKKLCHSHIPHRATTLPPAYPTLPVMGRRRSLLRMTRFSNVLAGILLPGLRCLRVPRRRAASDLLATPIPSAYRFSPFFLPTPLLRAAGAYRAQHTPTTPSYYPTFLWFYSYRNLQLPARPVHEDVSAGVVLLFARLLALSRAAAGAVFSTSRTWTRADCGTTAATSPARLHLEPTFFSGDGLLDMDASRACLPLPMTRCCAQHTVSIAALPYRAPCARASTSVRAACIKSGLVRVRTLCQRSAWRTRLRGRAGCAPSKTTHSTKSPRRTFMVNDWQQDQDVASAQRLAVLLRQDALNGSRHAARGLCRCVMRFGTGFGLHYRAKRTYCWREHRAATQIDTLPVCRLFALRSIRTLHAIPLRFFSTSPLGAAYLGAPNLPLQHSGLCSIWHTAVWFSIPPHGGYNAFRFGLITQHEPWLDSNRAPNVFLH